MVSIYYMYVHASRHCARTGLSVCLKTLCAHWAERLLSPLLRVDSSIGRFALERVRSIADGPCLHFEWMTANALRLEIVAAAIG